MEYVEAPEPYRGNAVKLFLAGGITDCPDWQEDMIGALAHTDYAIFNPRRKNFPMHDPQAAEEQVEWEFNALRDADVVSFWFASGPSVQPIALYELGYHITNPDPLKRVLVGVDPNYLRRQDVEIQVRLVRGHGFPIYRSLDDLCGAIEVLEDRIRREGTRATEWDR